LGFFILFYLLDNIFYELIFDFGQRLFTNSIIPITFFNIMHTLIIKAHPSSKGFTHIIANKYQQTRIDAGHTCDVLDLYKEPRQDYLVYEDKHEERVDQIALREVMQARITKADELVFIHPMWWGIMPAILKNWLDVNFSSGFSHKYENHKPVPLLKGKTARVFITSDAPAVIYSLVGFPYKTIWSLITFRFVGIKTTSVELFGDMRNRSDDKINKILAKVASLAK
jgi:NAD(P)H dehydrogenase (quinone)